MSDKKEKRLIKIASEFNVGIATIVEFLQKKGFKIPSNPNAKVSDECYEILQREYSSQLSVKKESEKLNLRKNRAQKESVTIDDLNEDDDFEGESESDSAQDEVLIIKDLSGKKKITESSHIDNRKHKGLNILGKIDLDQPKKKVSVTDLEDKTKLQITHSDGDEVVENESFESVEKHHEPQEELVSAVEKNTIKKDEEIIEPTESDDIKSDTTIYSYPNNDLFEEEEYDDDYEEEETDDRFDDNKLEKHVKPEKDEELKLEREDDIKLTAENNKPEKFENEIKVLGKIDLDSLNQKTRPDKKTRKQKEEERRLKDKGKSDKFKPFDKTKKRAEESKPASEKVAVKKTPIIADTKKSQVVDPDLDLELDDTEEIFRTEITQLTGPTVVGKIDLPLEKKAKKKPVASSSDKSKRKKKKRKRIGKGFDDVETEVTSKQKAVDKESSEKKRFDKTLKSQTTGTSEADKKKARTKRPKRFQKTEVNEEDVQKQIKETLARLTAGKHKSKGAKHRRLKREQFNKKTQDEVVQQEKEKMILKVTEFVSVNELANMMNVSVNEVIAECMNLGLFVGINQRIDAETIVVIADEFGFEVEFVSIDLQEAIKEEIDDEADLIPRAPIVTVMGHVDHGKTSLLDFIRKTNVIEDEAGGITQHIAAYRVTLENGSQITFLDTPGHMAFTAMRARGAQITDVVIIVISADDNVMPQTVEAINHSQVAGVPMVFAINKIDKPGANPEKIKEELANMNLLVEDWGGKYQSQEISAKKGLNINTLLEKVLLEAEMLELKANPKRLATGTVIEASLDRGMGYTSTVLVQNGTLKVGDFILAGVHTGRVKAMYNERKQRVKSVGPSEPVLILGLDGAPQAGDKFNVMSSEREAKELANKREQLQREQGLRAQKHITLDEIGRRIAIGNFKELNIIVKGDVGGTVEALADSLIKLSTEQVQVNTIHKAVGEIGEGDIMLAAASNAIVVGFQVRPSMAARKLAEAEGIDIRIYSIIYDAINEIKDAIEGMLSPVMKEEIIGTAEVLETFRITKVGTVAGCIVRDGKLFRTSKIRIIREGIVIYTGDLGSLKRFKDDAKEVKVGFECGLNIEKFNDIKVGDIIEAFEQVEVKQKLD